mmetsp:Transcript_35993/g.91222  ORF Transcript_35993/g.91222 Transcript_35993/m.91222 type:complete len:211 (-) Transcript_35993:321-953(-)
MAGCTSPRRPPRVARGAQAELLVVSSAQDELARVLLLVARADALGVPAPGRARGPPARAPALAAAHRVVDGVHRDTAHLGPPPDPPAGARLAQHALPVAEVAHRADGGGAPAQHLAHLARGELDHHVPFLLGDETRARARRAHELRSAAWRELDVVDVEAVGDDGEGHRVAHLEGRALAALEHLALLQPVGRQDVRGRAVAHVPNQRDEA